MWKVRIKKNGTFHRYNAQNVIISGDVVSIALKIGNGMKYLNFSFKELEDVKITRTKENENG